MSDLENIRKAHNVPAKLGGRVGYQGRLGTITGATKVYVVVRWDGERDPCLCHPTNLAYFNETADPAPPKLRADGNPWNWPFPERRVADEPLGRPPESTE